MITLIKSNNIRDIYSLLSKKNQDNLKIIIVSKSLFSTDNHINILMGYFSMLL